MVYRKPQPDLYTVLLVIALLAIIVGIVFMYLELNAYDFKAKGGPAVTMHVPAAEAVDAFASPAATISCHGADSLAPARFFASLRVTIA